MLAPISMPAFPTKSPSLIFYEGADEIVWVEIGDREVKLPAQHRRPHGVCCPCDVQHKVIAVEAPSPTEARFGNVLLIEVIVIGVICFQTRDRADVDTAAGEPVADELFLGRG